MAGKLVVGMVRVGMAVVGAVGSCSVGGAGGVGCTAGVTTSPGDADPFRGARHAVNWDCDEKGRRGKSRKGFRQMGEAPDASEFAYFPVTKMTGAIWG